MIHDPDIAQCDYKCPIGGLIKNMLVMLLKKNWIHHSLIPTLPAWPLRGHMALKSILWETLFLDQLDFR